MPTELEELVEFLHHGNTQIRQIGKCPSTHCPRTGQNLVLRSLNSYLKHITILPEPSLTRTSTLAVENLVPYSKTQPSIFKTAQLTPIKDLKLLVKDYPPIAKNALTILINISTDPEILKSLAEDDALLESIFIRVT
ncbi:MAG: hypothetical protein Q9212_001568, partial [Teloschistes hypoglaucus]